MIGVGNFCRFQHTQLLSIDSSVHLELHFHQVPLHIQMVTHSLIGEIFVGYYIEVFHKDSHGASFRDYRLLHIHLAVHSIYEEVVSPSGSSTYYILWMLPERIERLTQGDIAGIEPVGLLHLASGVLSQLDGIFQRNFHQFHVHLINVHITCERRISREVNGFFHIGFQVVSQHKDLTLPILFRPIVAPYLYLRGFDVLRGSFRNYVVQGVTCLYEIVLSIREFSHQGFVVIPH